MRVRRAEAFLARLPLRRSVRHALAERRETRNLLVRVEDEQGRAGWGEGVPRPYVTGEDPERAFAALAGSLLPRLVGFELADPGDLPRAVGALLPAVPGAQSSRCAAELALLDLAGRAFSRTAASWIGGPVRETVRYAGVLPLAEARELPALLEEARRVGVAHLKVKAAGTRWPEAVLAARASLGPRVSISLDVNGSWGFDEALAGLRRAEALGVAWVEQPLARGREEEVVRLAARTAIPLMADESLTTEEEARRLVAAGGFRLFNVRCSKLGGLLTARRVADLAAGGGVGVQVGCMVGESAILSAAGRLLAASLPGIAALEGSYGTRLLERDVVAAPFGFGDRGEAPVQRGDGLGVEVARALVEPLVLRSASFP